MLYVDMDGVLARWNSNASIEETHMPGYFLTPDCETKVAELIRMLYDNDHDSVCLLSSVYPDGTAMADKISWLNANHLEDIPRIFVPYGQDKNLYVPHGPNVLLDDFSRNLHAWEKHGYTGIKFLNGINGTRGTWHGYCIHHDMSVHEMLVIANAVAADTKARFAA